MSEKPTILVCAEHYLPGYRAGGPIRSISALVERLSDTFDFAILTSDRDWGADEPYDAIEYGRWHEVGVARVRYLTPAERRFRRVYRLLGELDFDALYVNSLYSLTFSLPAVVRFRLGALGGAPLVVAPKGQLAPSAIDKKKWKKWPYLFALASSGLYDGVRWRASNETEAERIRNWFGPEADVTVAPDLTASPPEDAARQEPNGVGRLRMVFLSRLHPVKNLDYLLERLADVDQEVSLDIYGPVDDERHWRGCRERIEALPANIDVEYRGAVAPTEVIETLADYDLFALPTEGENFGHAIYEALAAGTAVLISDRTRWRGLEEEGVGWVVSLEREAEFVDRIEEAAAAESERLAEMGRRARRYAERETGTEDAVERSRELFRAAIEFETC